MCRGPCIDKAAVDILAAANATLNAESDGDTALRIQVHAAYLQQIQICANTLDINAASRSYRMGFTPNYAALFDSDHKRVYRTDVLQASRDSCPSMVVNGKTWQFSGQAQYRAGQLNHCMEKLNDFLKSWSAGEHSETAVDLLKAILDLLDHAWASFEKTYINELIGVESLARLPLLEATRIERQMTILEGKRLNNICRFPKYLELQRKLFEHLSKINAVANVNRVGRSDLSEGPLIAAQEVLRSLDDVDADGPQLVRALSENLVGSFQAMRKYLKTVGSCLELVDPHLNKNAGLVACLEDLEEAWEMALRFVYPKSMPYALDHTSAAIKDGQVLVPDLTRMFADCDPEVFFVLSRIVLLSFLRNPAQDALLRSLLPSCFAGIDCSLRCQSTIRVLVVSISVTNQLGAGDCAVGLAWSILIQRAILGPDLDGNRIYVGLKAKLREKTRRVVEGFMHELEKWSFELQRHSPKDWNECAAVFLRFHSGGNKIQRQSDFRV